ncbi:MAG: hypothetical protein RIT14_2353 [Pseudomonadota bacterium]|jgi:hypothetical protein
MAYADYTSFNGSAPRNLYAAKRMGLDAKALKSDGRNELRQLTKAIVTGFVIAANAALIGSIMPSVFGATSAATAVYADLQAPAN